MVDEVLEAHSAGSPTDEAVRWTDLEPVRLAQQVLARAGYRRRSLRKALISGDVDPHARRKSCWVVVIFEVIEEMDSLVIIPIATVFLVT